MSTPDMHAHLRSAAEARALAAGPANASLSVGQKVDLIADYLAAFPRAVLVETGLWEGWGSTMRLVLAWPGPPLELHRHLLIDLDERNCELARERMQGYPATEIHHGDSARLLPLALEGLEEPALFWLDAHDAESESCPLWAELSAIVAHPLAREHVVLVDDVRMTGGAEHEPWPGFPTFESVLWIAGPYWDAEVAGDVLRLTPKREET